jgi:hypothetical protein
MYTLIIKGDETAAFAACRAHKVEILSISRHERFDECIVAIPGGLPSRTTLYDWFNASDDFACAHADGIYPPGSLMWFGPRQAVPVANPPVPGWDKVEGGTDA